MIKILALADLHGDEQVLDRLRVLESDRKYDYLFIAGDVTRNSVSYAEDLLEITDGNLFWVPGNNETPEVREVFEKAGASVHEKKVELGDGFNVVGFGFSLTTPFHTPGELTEEAFYERMRDLPIDRNTLLLLHSPPYGVFDEIEGGIHLGSRSIRKIIEEKQPKMAFFGHVHETEGKANIGYTICVKVPFAERLRAAAVTIEDGHAEVSFVRI